MLLVFSEIYKYMHSSIEIHKREIFREKNMSKDEPDTKLHTWRKYKNMNLKE